jgi:hypothetical protein
LASLEIILESYGGNPWRRQSKAWASGKRVLSPHLEQMSPRDLSPEVKNTLDLIAPAGEGGRRVFQQKYEAILSSSGLNTI